MDLAVERSYPTPYANSSLLPLLLMSLMRQKNAPKTTTNVNAEYDFVIVGAGSAGFVVASRLSEIPCVSVLVLEAGPSPPLLTDVPAIQSSFWAGKLSWNYKTVPQKHTAKALTDRRISLPTGKTVGGTSVLNAMFYVRGNKENYNGWAQQGAVGWSYSDVKPYFLKSENNTSPGYVADGYHSVDGLLSVSTQRYASEIKKPVLEAAIQMGIPVTDPNGRSQLGSYDPQTTELDGQRCSTAKAFLVPAENRTNLHIVKNAFVRKILFEGNRATGVLYETETGQTLTVRARKETIVSAGTINTAQLLMLSGIGPREHLEHLKIPVIADLPVGNNFQDHLGTYLYFLIDSKYPKFKQKITNKRNILEYIDIRRGPLTSTLSDPMLFLTTPNTQHPNVPDYIVYFSETPIPTIQNSYDISTEIIEEYFKNYQNSTPYRCWVQNLHPKSRGTIRLSSIDPHDPPLIDPNFLQVPEDVEPMVEGLKTCLKFANSAPLKAIGSRPLHGPVPTCKHVFDDVDKYLECIARSTILSYYHPVGSCKMGDVRDTTTVVSPRLKVKGISGLRVADASIMPTITASNTNIPTIMIGEKAADIIKNRLTCDTQIPA